MKRENSSRNALTSSRSRKVPGPRSRTSSIPTSMPEPATGTGLPELHALRQRQLRGVVDRVGRAPHVGLPRIRTGLAPAAGLLLAAERAADLRTRGADVDVGD